MSLQKDLGAATVFDAEPGSSQNPAVARPLTRAMKFALCVAAHRPRQTICPVKTGKGRLHNAAETALVEALDRRGLIDWNGPIPIINKSGIAVVNAEFAKLPTEPTP